MPILVAGLVLASGLALSCSESQEPGAAVTQDTASWTEKQVIEHLYGYLRSKAEQLQGAAGQAQKIIMEWKFRDALIVANKEMMDEDSVEEWGKLIETRHDEPMPEPGEMSIWTVVFTGALRRVAQYDENGWWSVSISDWEWRVNERTREVIAQNEEATKLLEEITLKTYHNSIYGYYLDYPPSWTVNDEDRSNVLIFSGSPEAVKAFVFISVIEEAELDAYKDLQEYMAARVSSLQSQYHEFEVTETASTRIDYTYMLREDAPRHEAKHHFVQYGSKVYEIVSSAELTPFLEYYSLSPLYDPFDSFRLQPSE